MGSTLSPPARTPTIVSLSLVAMGCCSPSVRIFSDCSKRLSSSSETFYAFWFRNASDRTD